MAAPIVSWWATDNVTAISKWDLKTIDAGSESADFTVLIWNNRYPGSPATKADLSTMTNCTITTKDELGNDTGELVNNTWIRVRVDTMAETAFTPVGGTTKKEIQAGGTTVNVDGSFSPNQQEILGVKNDGALADAGNYAKVTLKAKVPATATAGNVNFLTRVAYQYI